MSRDVSLMYSAFIHIFSDIFHQQRRLWLYFQSTRQVPPLAPAKRPHKPFTAFIDPAAKSFHPSPPRSLTVGFGAPEAAERRNTPVYEHQARCDYDLGLRAVFRVPEAPFEKKRFVN